MKFIHIADVHLGAAPDAGKSWSEQRSREIWEGLDHIFEVAKTQQVDFIFIAGDLFHRQPLLRELKELNYKFAALSPIHVVMIAGNHDYLKADSRYRTFEWSANVTFFKSQKMECMYFKRQNTYIYGLSYENYEIETPLYDNVRPVRQDGCHILLAHGGDSTHSPMNFNGIVQAGFDYAALGHIHKPQIFLDGLMAYAGALQPIDKNDTGEHGYIYGMWDGASVNIQFVPLDVRQYIHFTVVMDGHMPWGMAVDFAAAEISKRGQQHIYKIIFSGFRDPDIEMDLSRIYSLGNVLEVIDETKPDYDFDALYEANKGNLIGLFIQRVRELPAASDSKEKALHYGIKALLNEQL